MRFRGTIVIITALLMLSGVAQARDDESFDLDKTYSIDKDGTIYLTCNDADLTIVGSDRKDVHVFVEYRLDVTGFGRNWRMTEFGFEVREESGNLRIRDEEVQLNSMGMIRWNEDYTIRIEAPRGVSLRLRLDDDNVRIRDIDGSVSVTMSDGRAILESLGGSDFEFEFDDGSIEMIGGKGTLDVVLDDGEFFATQGDFSEIIGRTEDGSIEIATKLHDEGRYRLTADDGELYLTVLSGGGQFYADFDDGRARATREFKEIDEDDHFREWELAGGKARVNLRVSDGRVSLKKD